MKFVKNLSKVLISYSFYLNFQGIFNRSLQLHKSFSCVLFSKYYFWVRISKQKCVKKNLGICRLSMGHRNDLVSLTKEYKREFFAPLLLNFQPKLAIRFSCKRELLFCTVNNDTFILINLCCLVVTLPTWSEIWTIQAV